MRFKKYFRTSRFEPRLIDVISFFYIFKVLLYTSSDVKDKYPATLIVLGLIFHGIAYIVWRTEYGSKSIITSEKVKSFLYQVLPFGLTVTYSLSIREGFIRGEVSSSNIDDFMKFVIVMVPMIIYFFQIAFMKKDRNRGFFYIKKRMVNISYLTIYLLTLTIDEII
jgi:hypothetical protein